MVVSDNRTRSRRRSRVAGMFAQPTAALSADNRTRSRRRSRARAGSVGHGRGTAPTTEPGQDVAPECLPEAARLRPLVARQPNPVKTSLPRATSHACPSWSATRQPNPVKTSLPSSKRRRAVALAWARQPNPVKTSLPSRPLPH